MKLGLPQKEPRTYVADSFAELFHHAINDCMKNPEFESAPRGQKIKELTDVQLLLSNPTNNLFNNPARGVNKRYLAGELIWYFSGDDSIEYIQKYSRFWGRIQNDDGTLNSAYGNLIFNDANSYNVTGWQWVIKSLSDDKDSRQALMHFSRPEHRRPGVKDFPCTIAAQFMIRDNMLNMYTTMRSNDFVFGLTYDLPFFTLLQQQVYQTMLAKYPDLKLGGYYHNAKSLHIYEKDFDIINEMLGHMFIEEKTPDLEAHLVDYQGNATFDLECVKQGMYTKNDPLLNWLQNNSSDK